MTRACSSCGAAITKRAKTGLCRDCASRRPKSAAARVKMSEGAKERWERELATDEGRARAQEAGRRVRAHPNRITAEPKRKAAIREAFIGWCPPEHRELNYKLRHRGIGIAERKSIILADVPGTIEHARRQIANHQVKQRLRVERERREAY